MKQISERVRLLNDKPENEKAKYVLYWMQMFKLTTHESRAEICDRAGKRTETVVFAEFLGVSANTTACGWSAKFFGKMR